MDHRQSHLNRRRFLTVGLAGLVGALAAWRNPISAIPLNNQSDILKHLIVLYMNGGPSHIDTFDPKPGTRSGGPYSAIKTRTPGLMISEYMPQVAEQTHHMSVIRSMSTNEGNHKRARYLAHTGYRPQGTVTHPGLGSIVNSEVAAHAGPLPQFVSIGSPSYGGGVLGSSLDPLFIRDPAKPLENISHPKSIGHPRFENRMEILSWMEDRFVAKYGTDQVGHQQLYEKAKHLMFSDLTAAFDVAQEPDHVRAAYGANTFGRGCLMARRLVEAGVTAVEVTLDGWDTHEDNFTRSRELMGQLDPGFSMLIKDLLDRDLLGSTMILCLGEFGRTPRINGNEGRDHFPAAWSAVLAGGGIRGGYVHGQTDQEGSRVDAPVTVADLFGTVATAFGIDPAGEYYTPGGRPISLVDQGRVLREVLI